MKRRAWRVVRFYDILRMSHIMGVSLDESVKCRMKTLKEQLVAINNIKPSNRENALYKKYLLKQVREEMTRLNADYNNYLRRKDSISDEMIAFARNFPVDRLVEFNENGFARAPCHHDMRPSLHFIGPHAYCFTCCKVINAIDVLMLRDGMDFVAAVTRLGQQFEPSK